MARSFDEIIRDLAALNAGDFDENALVFDGPERLEELTGELFASPQRESGIRVLFDVMERMPEAELGTPGPLVHTLEAIPGYAPALEESVKRIPTPLSVWMINRILNADNSPENRLTFMNLLRSVAGHPLATEATKQRAEHFVEYQNKKST